MCYLINKHMILSLLLEVTYNDESMPICYLQPNYAKKTRNYLYNPENENRKARDGYQN